MKNVKPLSLQHWVVVIGPAPAFAYRVIFESVAESITHALRPFVSRIDIGTLDIPCDQHLIFAAHHFHHSQHLPSNAILFNLEQIDAMKERTDLWAAFWPSYQQRLLTHDVWDYSGINVQALRNMGASRVTPLPLGYEPAMTRVPKNAFEDIDVLFYGSKNERRQKVLDQLRNHGLNVVEVPGLYGAHLDPYIARAKLVINIHYYDSKVLEMVRLSHLLANRKAIVCEASEPDPHYDALLPGMCVVPYEGLVEACLHLLRDEPVRQALARRGFVLFSRCDLRASVATALGLPAPPPLIVDSGLPDTLNLGSGKDFQDDAFNIDINADWGPDAVIDMGSDLPWGQPIRTARFGDVVLRDHLFERIVANDVLEHIPDLVKAMHNALRLLRPGGQFEIGVPYDLSLGAWQDPTHVRAFNENSWLYYTDWFWYLGWDDWRFDCPGVVFVPSALGQRMTDEGVALEVIQRTPRAIDAMRVTLIKRHQNERELKLMRDRRAQQRARQQPVGDVVKNVSR